MAAAYCYEGIPLIFLASLFDIQMRYLVYMRYLWCVCPNFCDTFVFDRSNLLCTYTKFY